MQLFIKQVFQNIMTSAEKKAKIPRLEFSFTKTCRNILVAFKANQIGVFNTC